jgi:hypothetical protein
MGKISGVFFLGRDQAKVMIIQIPKEDLSKLTINKILHLKCIVQAIE